MKVRVWHIIVFVAAFLVFAAASAPASFFAPQRSEAFSYEQVGGSVWAARLQNVRLGSYSARELSWRVFPLDLVQGKARVPVWIQDGGIEGDGMLLANWEGDRRIVINTLRLDGAHLGEIDLPGETSLRDFDVFFEDGRCARASGRGESDVLQGAGERLGWPGPRLAGEAACDGDDGRIVMSGVNELGDQASLEVRLSANGAVQWRFDVQSTRPEPQAALAAVGFSPDGEGMAMRGEGRWLPF